jgi:hypothetical protein
MKDFEVGDFVILRNIEMNSGLSYAHKVLMKVDFVDARFIDTDKLKKGGWWKHRFHNLGKNKLVRLFYE